MYDYGAHGYFDAVGWHPYSYPHGLGYYAKTLCRTAAACPRQQ